MECVDEFLGKLIRNPLQLFALVHVPIEICRISDVDHSVFVQRSSAAIKSEAAVDHQQVFRTYGNELGSIFLALEESQRVMISLSMIQSFCSLSFIQTHSN